jgi:transcriptional regulator with XRE-family HTH domain
MAQDDHTPHINVDIFEDLTGEISPPKPDSAEDIGERIKAIREKRGLDLEDIAKITGFSVAFLSDMESSASQPQLGDIIKLSKALDSAFGDLVSKAGSAPYAITRKNEGAAVAGAGARGGGQAYLYKSLAADVKDRNMESFIVQLEANPEDEMSLHEGEEFIYVLNGEVSLKIGSDEFILNPGDSAYYLSATPHLITAAKDKATIIAVIYGR